MLRSVNQKNFKKKMLSIFKKKVRKKKSKIWLLL